MPEMTKTDQNVYFVNNYFKAHYTHFNANQKMSVYIHS